MKLIALALLSVLFISGCGNSAPYKIFETRKGPLRTLFRVDVPAGASNAQIEQWANEIASGDSAPEKVMINFYDGAHDISGYRATYQGGKFYDIRRKGKRQVKKPTPQAGGIVK